MSRHLLDLNTLLALLNLQHVFHDAAHRWVETTQGSWLAAMAPASPPSTAASPPRPFPTASATSL